MMLTAPPDLSLDDDLDLSASTVTSTRATPVRVRRTLPAETVARSLAALLSLPSDLPYALRNDVSAEYLDPARPIGDQIQPGGQITITPKTHLG